LKWANLHNINLLAPTLDRFEREKDFYVHRWEVSWIFQLQRMCQLWGVAKELVLDSWLSRTSPILALVLAKLCVPAMSCHECSHFEEQDVEGAFPRKEVLLSAPKKFGSVLEWALGQWGSAMLHFPMLAHLMPQ